MGCVKGVSEIWLVQIDVMITNCPCFSIACSYLCVYLFLCNIFPLGCKMEISLYGYNLAYLHLRKMFIDRLYIVPFVFFLQIIYIYR